MTENMKLYQERKDKVGAMTPKPEYGSFRAVHEHLAKRRHQITGQRVQIDDEISTITDVNLRDYLQLCVAGLAHIPDLAERRLARATENHALAMNAGMIEALSSLGTIWDHLQL